MWFETKIKETFSWVFEMRMDSKYIFLLKVCKWDNEQVVEKKQEIMHDDPQMLFDVAN